MNGGLKRRYLGHVSTFEIILVGLFPQILIKYWAVCCSLFLKVESTASVLSLWLHSNHVEVCLRVCFEHILLRRYWASWSHLEFLWHESKSFLLHVYDHQISAVVIQKSRPWNVIAVLLGNNLNVFFVFLFSSVVKKKELVCNFIRCYPTVGNAVGY